MTHTTHLVQRGAAHGSRRLCSDRIGVRQRSAAHRPRCRQFWRLTRLPSPAAPATNRVRSCSRTCDAGRATGQRRSVRCRRSSTTSAVASIDPCWPRIRTASRPHRINVGDDYALSRHFRRADGRNTPGVDVPFGLDGGVSVTISDGQRRRCRRSRSSGISSKLEPPLRNLVSQGGIAIHLRPSPRSRSLAVTRMAMKSRSRVRLTSRSADFGDPTMRTQHLRMHIIMRTTQALTRCRDRNRRSIAACTVKDVDTPPLAGPSSLARTIVMVADRDTLASGRQSRKPPFA